MSDFRDHIAVIDYGMGNLHSVAKALEHSAPSASVTVTSDPQIVENADRVVFPGVGAIRDCMHEIQRLNLGPVVKKAIQSKPVLAICVGMQALMQTSEENGGIDCLRLLPGQVKNILVRILKINRAISLRFLIWGGTMLSSVKTIHFGTIFSKTVVSILYIATMLRLMIIPMYLPLVTTVKNLPHRFSKGICLQCSSIQKKVPMLGYSY